MQLGSSKSFASSSVKPLLDKDQVNQIKATQNELQRTTSKSNSLGSFSIPKKKSPEPQKSSRSSPSQQHQHVTTGHNTEAIVSSVVGYALVRLEGHRDKLVAKPKTFLERGISAEQPQLLIQFKELQDALNCTASHP